jgi:hypothetical protein
MEQQDMIKRLGSPLDGLGSLEKTTLEKFINEIELIRNYAISEEVEPE